MGVRLEVTFPSDVLMLTGGKTGQRCGETLRQLRQRFNQCRYYRRPPMRPSLIIIQSILSVATLEIRTN